MMDNQDLINSYLIEYNKICAQAKEHDFTDEQIDRIYKESVQVLTQNELQTRKTSKCVQTLTLFIIILPSIYILLYLHQPTSSLVLRNVQSFIYPGFTLVRQLSIPIISLFPTLTAFYDESCLVENPYFQVSNLDCFPCENVHALINLTGLSLTNSTFYETGAPFIISDQRPEVTLNQLIKVYKDHADTFNENAPCEKLHAGHELFDDNARITWRINRMLPARILRQFFPRPAFISSWSGQSIERYIIIDGPKSDPYLLPNFECSYVFYIQSSGERNILLRPTNECRNNCKTLSVEMKPHHILWYNWWYWKPLSLPAENATNISVSYVNSYC